ncbi:hypothetical protein [Rathayibacter soli]|uniref:hypothetical protein n=1 Tax=Rathayibacter soli TaxID=3144168 RepID=UPI0027E55403|nr:hypothetical protein [Glaciibacter superstes]
MTAGAGSDHDAATGADAVGRLPESRFGDLVEFFASMPGVIPPGVGDGFGSSALRIDGKIFAMLVRAQLVLKLPTARVDELVADGAGTRYDANKRVPMKQWLMLDVGTTRPWTLLATEALEFVRNG